MPMTLNELINAVDAEGLRHDLPLVFHIFDGDDIVELEIDEVSEGIKDDISIYLSEIQ